MVLFGVKACWATSLYARIHSSTVMPNRPSMIAMILCGKLLVRRTRLVLARSYPPVLVPPIRSKYSHGRGTLSRPSASRSFSMIFSRMRRLDMPRIPPPSAQSQHASRAWRTRRYTEREDLQPRREVHCRSGSPCHTRRGSVSG